MMPIIHQYSKLCAEWAIASREKYRSDLFFRTTVQIIAMQTGLVLVCLIAFWFSLYNPGASWLAFGGLLVMSAALGGLIARFTLRPARDTLRYQKIFISNVAHELRTPLSVIKTSTEVALIDDSMPSEHRRTFYDIVGELNRISEIINNLLSLSTLTRPERMQLANTDLGPLVSTVMKRHDALAHERGIKLVVKNDPYTTVWGNATALEQVITNLVKNAISYTPKGARGVVTVVVRPEQDMILLNVTDTGIGISQEDLAHIFEPFYRADISRVRKVKKEGSGLGLTIVNEIVRIHHGKIQIESTRKKGTSVSVYFPQGVGAGSKHGKDEIQSRMFIDFSRPRVPGNEIASVVRVPAQTGN